MKLWKYSGTFLAVTGIIHYYIKKENKPAPLA